MKKKVMIGLGVAAIVAVAALLVAGRGDGAVSGYRFVEVTRGTIEATVSATGALGAVSTVQVGTQVSGQVAEIHADFNDRVRAGQLIARIDPTLQEQAVREAQAALTRAEADLDQRQFQFEQAKPLWEQRVITETEYRAAEYNLAVAEAGLVSAKASLERAQRNLNYTYIHAPIAGTVIERNVEIGQTVAASLSAPQLFLIAEDLARMQILVSVDESDIGSICEGQDVRFTVQAYPEESFAGVVRQVRLQSKSQDNVVNYTVVVAVSNPEGKLLPGMTATVDFILAQATNALAVPNAALRFRATEAMQAEVRGAMQAVAGGRGDPAGSGGLPGTRGSGGGRASADSAAAGPRAAPGGSLARLWYLDDTGQLRVARVTAGLTDGQVTEVSGPDLREGMQVIAAVTTNGGTAATAVTNPFQSQQQRAPGGGPPGPPPGGF